MPGKGTDIMKTSRIASILLAGLAALSPALALENRPALPPDVPAGGGTILDGTMDVLVVNGCYALITGTADTPNLGGSVSAAINYWDDGTWEGGDPLSFPADGATHDYCVVHQQLVPVLQGAAGLGIYLEDDLGLAATQTFDSDGSVDISDICTGAAPVCPNAVSIVEVPTIGRTGFAILFLALASAAVVVLKRRRKSTI